MLERERVLAATGEAFAAGVRTGMRRGGVSAIAPRAILHERDGARETATLGEVALTLLQYTPEVALFDHSSVLLDISASLSAFGGRQALCRRVRASVEALGLSTWLGMAPTARGAWLLAQQQGHARPGAKGRRCIQPDSLARRLDALPFALLPAAAPYAEWLEGIGCQTLGDLRRLPRAGLQRRSQRALLDEIDCAYGQAPELFDWVVAPPVFDLALELPDRIEHAEAVLFAARRLLLQMSGWLVARQMAVVRLVLWLQHERGRSAIAPTALEIVLAQAVHHEEHLTRLLKERLGRLELCAPVIAIRLQSQQVAAMDVPSDMLFAEPGGTAADHARLLELLRARLGEDCVMMPRPVADYRPEVGNAWVAACAGTARTVKAARLAAEANSQARTPHGSANLGERPFWLLAQPLALMMRDHRPFYGSPLRLVSGPERIESGWWDGALAVRDYFIAQGSDHASYWVYRERAGQQSSWFLHGLFA